MVPDPKHPEAFASQIVVTAAVRSGCVVLPTIGFDHQHRFEADKINDIRPDWMLAAEFPAEQFTVAQMTPQPSLCIRHRASQSSGEVLLLSFAHPCALLHWLLDSMRIGNR